MGSSLSLPSKDKRRRSNRLSKAQATLGSPSSHTPHQPAGQALSLPSTPTAWRNPWISVSVPIDPSDIASRNLRPQSISSQPLRCDTTWKSNGPLVAQRNTHKASDLWPQLPTSPIPTPSRRGSMYGRASFHPSAIATFQPTTLQSNPQSPLMGLPKRSYSVHSPSQKFRNATQRRALDNFAPFNFHSRVNSQDSLPIRRRSLLVRPGVATRNATKNMPNSLFSSPSKSGIVSPDPHNALFKPIRLPFLADEGAIFNDLEPLAQSRPPTPSDFGYTHLGALKLGSLRVFNGIASPCPSDRTRLGHSGSPTPEALPDNLNSPDLPRPIENGIRVSRPTSPDGLEVYTKYYPILNNASGLDDVLSNLPIETAPPGRNIPNYQTTPANKDMSATMLNISPVPPARDGIDFPASPFSFDESPTSVSGHKVEPRKAEGEGITFHDTGRVPVSVPGKVPKRHLSYSSCASSHRKVDSGYSSATSHRSSIESHSSLRRSPGFRRFTLGDKSRKLEFHNINTSTRTDDQPTSHYFTLQGQKWNYRPDVRELPMSMSGVQRGRHSQANGRLRGSSLPLPVSSGHALSLPLYYTQLHDLESADPEITSSTTPPMSDSSTGRVEGPLHLGYGSGDSSYPCPATLPVSAGHDLRGDINQEAGFDPQAAALLSGHPSLSNHNSYIIREYQVDPEDGSPQEFSTCGATQQYRRHNSGVKSDI